MIYNNKINLLFLAFSSILSMYIIRDFVINAKNKWRKKIVFSQSFLLSILLLLIVIISANLECFFVKRRINNMILILSTFLFLFAFLLRIWSKNSLKQYFSSHIQVKDGHKLVKEGSC